MEQHTQSKVAAFGDSVMWGQGIKHKNKFTTLMSKKLFNIQFAQSDNHAHSGASIGTSSRRELDQPNRIEFPVYGEIPRGKPTILRQIQRYGLQVPTNHQIAEPLKAQTFPNIDVVFLNGGINDIGAPKLVKGEFKSLREIERLARNNCEIGFLNVLHAARAKFPNAQLMSIGYHFVFSIQSMQGMVDAISIALKEDTDAISIYRNGVKACHYFMALSTAAFQKAVDKFNAVDLPKGNKGAYFVPTLHDESHASFAPKSLIWGIESIGDRLLSKLLLALGEWHLDHIFKLIKLKDEVSEERRAICNVYYDGVNDPAKHAACHMASLFHPNSRSARRVNEIAFKTYDDFKNNISLRSFTGDRRLSTSMKKLGFKSGSTLRQVFATNTISSIRLKGVVMKGSFGFFPYSGLRIRFRTKDNRSFTYKLNHNLPGIKGFADGQDYVYPVPFGRVVTSENGHFSTNKPIERDTRFNFFSFPNAIIPLDQVKTIEIVSMRNRKFARSVSIDLRNVGLEINGRTLSGIIQPRHLRVNKNRTESLPIWFS